MEVENNPEGLDEEDYIETESAELTEITVLLTRLEDEHISNADKIEIFNK